jgi:hypothetical protein
MLEPTPSVRRRESASHRRPDLLYFAPTPMRSPSRRFLCLAFLLSGCAVMPLGRLGLFEGETDVGAVSRPGSAAFDAGSGAYTVGASGANMWFKQDAMHYVWRKASGDVSIAADIAFVGASTQPHRKACLVIRQNLDPGSAYVDVAVHGDGLTSLQFRTAQDGTTKEIQSMVASPGRVRLDKIGDWVYLSVARDGGPLRPSGAFFVLNFHAPFYVGLAVTAHDNKAFETAVFSKVEVGAASQDAAVPQPGLRIITLPSGDRRVTDH